jgi:predicted peptidase
MNLTKQILGASLLLAGLNLTVSLLAEGTQTTGTYAVSVTKTVKMDYLIHLPEGYKAGSDKKWPLILFLHGSGERGTNVQKVAVHGPPKVAPTMKDFPFIVISPQCASGENWNDDALLGLLDEVMVKFPVDENRVYLTGLSMGGFGTWSLMGTAPQRFAAAAPICGGGNPLRLRLRSPEKQAALKALPVWAFHGAKDTTVQLKESEVMVEALQKLGATDVKLTVYPEAQHDSWTQTYANPEFYKWLLSHERKKAGQ